MLVERCMMRLLLVEDYLPLQKSVLKGLREAGFAVDVTGDGQEALWYAKSNQYDVIVLDLMLPGMDGLDVFRALRKHSSVPVIMLTAKASESDRVAGIEMGADDYIVKPFYMRELVARVKMVLRRAKAGVEPVEEIIRVRGISIDRARPAKGDAFFWPYLLGQRIKRTVV